MMRMYGFIAVVHENCVLMKEKVNNFEALQLIDERIALFCLARSGVQF